MENTDEIQVATDIEQDEKLEETNAYPSRRLVNDGAYLRRSAMEMDRKNEDPGVGDNTPTSGIRKRTIGKPSRRFSLNSSWTRIGTYTTESGL